MPGGRKQSKSLMEPFLQKMAVRDSSIVEKPKTTKFQKESHFTTARETSRLNTKEESNYRKNQGPKNGLELMRTSFPSFTTNSLQIKMQTHQFKKEVKKTQTAKIGAPQTPTTISLMSEASVRSSVSSIKSTIKTFLKIEENPSFYQRLVIPFSGFTEEDVKEIRGGKEPKSSKSSLPKYWTSTNDPRPVLKRYQSEKRKSSYERYVQESVENFLQARNNTEDSSYNTVLAVKMMVDDVTRIEEEISNANTDQNNGNNSKDTIYLPNSELLSARLDRIMNPPSPENSVTHNKNGPANPTTFKSGPKADCSYQRSKLMIMKKELDQVDKDFEKIQNEYDEAEKAYFTAKLNFHRMKMKRDKLLAQLSDLEKELCPEVECKSSLLQFD
ncbi:uncharacterized protein LOC123318284 [Coccinella septempunctata]|uniref:uncharacterized protein LOC123318284 n=1 Tax=Coccinella septempunctata TaxID=41139 RepID=UPI001D083819|nr:uncharacterized protein LOC123318284 [Coccinella septempunctata]